MSDQQLLNDLYATAARNEKDVITGVRMHLAVALAHLETTQD